MRSDPAKLLAAIRDYADEPRGPWSIIRRRPLTLGHAARRAAGVTFTLSRAPDGVALDIAGKQTRLALAYAATLLASERFATHVAAFTVEPPRPATS